MIPTLNLLEEDITEIVYQGKTYRIVFGDEDRISGYAEGLESVKQAIYLILNTERYQYPIYSWDYGIELLDLYGKPMSYVMAELPRRIEEALTVDDRIEKVTDFEFTKSRNKLHVTFTVITNVGNVQTEMEVNT
jgi:hypothetical protein